MHDDRDIPQEFSGWMPPGFQTSKIRRPQRNDIPEWATSNAGLMQKVLAPALRRLRVCHLYFRCGWNAREISEEMGLSVGAVQQIIHRLTVS